MTASLPRHRAPSAETVDGGMPTPRTEKSLLTPPQLAAGAQAFPCSFAQQRLWFLDRMAPGSPFYNVSIAFPIAAALDRRILQRTLSALVQRHETLRTTFLLIDGEPRQIVGAPFTVDVKSVDLRNLVPSQRELRTREIVTNEAEQPFDLERGPLIRCTLLQRGAFDHVLVLVLHHIVCDGWSLGILGRELTALYQAFSLGRPDRLPELPIQYVDFAVWQRERLQGALLDEQLAFWRDRLSGLETLDLPTDRPRPAVLSFAGAMHDVRLPSALTARVRAAARQFGVTPYMLLLAAFAALLHRYSGQTDIAIGAPLAGRSQPEIEPLVGFFVNSVVLRIDVAGDPSFAELVSRVRDTALDAFTHQELPFEKLVEEIRPPRDPSRNPMFQVSLQLVNLPGWEQRADAPAQPPIQAQHRTAIFDLAFTLIDAPAGFSGVIEYNTDLFDAATVAALDRRFQLLLDSAIEAPDTPVGRLALIDARERAARLATAAGAALQAPCCRVLETIERQAQDTPDAVAIQSADGSEHTYRELRGRWHDLAGRLAALGVGPEIRVAVCMEPCADAVAALLAVLAAGGVYVPLDPTYPRQRLRFMLQDSKAAVVLTQAKHVSRGSILEGCAARPLLLDADEALSPIAATDKLRAVHPDNLAYVIYTSGSTGQPKGVAVSHRAMANHMAWMLEAFPLRSDDRVLQRTAASFDASVWEFLAPLMAGARLILPAVDTGRDASGILRTIVRTGVTVVQLVPPLLRVLLEEPELRACKSLRRVFCGGEALPEDLRARTLESLAVEFVNLYGPTEATIDATAFICSDGPTPLGVPIGRPIANSCVHVLDQSLQLTPPGLEGELYIGGAGLARGYLDRPGLTAERFVPDPFAASPGARLYRTGDRVRLLPDGNIVFVGRIDRQLKIRGYRIEPGEIEAAIRQVAGVRDCAVIADPAGLSLAALLVPDSALGATAEQAADQGLVERVRLLLGARLPDYMVPSRFLPVEALPLSPNGKLDLATLQLQLSQRPGAEVGYVPPRTPVEEALALIWAQTLGLDRVGIHDGFFAELGGHSILATQIIARVRDALRVEVPLKLIFIAQTIERFAAALLESPPAQRQLLQRTAELYVKLSRMSDEELDLALAESSVAESSLVKL